MAAPRSIKIGSFEFSPRLFPTVVAIVLIYLLTQLGQWQLGRAHFKEDRIARFADRGEQNPFSYTELLALEQDWADYPTELFGKFDKDKIILLDNRVHDMKAGYHVIVPFLPDDHDTWVLVNLGWVIANPRRDIFPDVQLPERETHLTGWVHEPNPNFFTLAEQDYSLATWPLVIQKTELKKLGPVLERKLAPFTVRLKPNPDENYVRTWQRYPMPPEKHRAYAFQWFALAIALTIIYFAVTLKKRR